MLAANVTLASGSRLTIGNAAMSEADLEQLDGITAGTAAGSKAVVLDANKDIGTLRNITLSGELDAGSLDISGNADIDGTLEADAITINGTAIGSVYICITRNI
jgi:cytoskeletal protein CcmA (bactofilin family)